MSSYHQHSVNSCSQLGDPWKWGFSVGWTESQDRLWSGPNICWWGWVTSVGLSLSDFWKQEARLGWFTYQRSFCSSFLGVSGFLYLGPLGWRWLSRATKGAAPQKAGPEVTIPRTTGRRRQGWARKRDAVPLLPSSCHHCPSSAALPTGSLLSHASIWISLKKR